MGPTHRYFPTRYPDDGTEYEWGVQPHQPDLPEEIEEPDFVEELPDQTEALTPLPTTDTPGMYDESLEVIIEWEQRQSDFMEWVQWMEQLDPLTDLLSGEDRCRSTAAQLESSGYAQHLRETGHYCATDPWVPTLEEAADFILHEGQEQLTMTLYRIHEAKLAVWPFLIHPQID
jgi:hypothetical protein